MESKPYVRSIGRQVRRAGLLLGAILICAALVLPTAVPAQAQGTGRPVAVGDVISDTLDSDNFVRAYRLPASSGDTISIDVTTEDEALELALIVVNENGTVVDSDVDTTSPTTASLADVVIPANGDYYILVMRGSGATGDASGTFTMRLTGIQQVGGQTVVLEDGGITFDLLWDAAVDLNLEVRDPVGGTVQRFNAGSPSGGVLDADVNANCEAAIATGATETIAWPAGEVPAGSYEIIIYYTDPCDVGGPQLFTLNVTANGGTTQSLIGTLNPGQEYLARLELSPDATWQLVNGGVNAGLDVTVFRDQLGNPEPIAIGSTVQGVITNDSPARAYTFTADAGTTIRAEEDAQSGSLDTYLALLGPDGQVIVTNDDEGDSTDAGITRTLATAGNYTLLATRYGLAIGGTEGEFTLTLTAQETAATPTAEGTPAPQTTETASALPQGAIEVRLDWSTNADMQLLVRDPVGDSVYDDNPTITSGGTLQSAGNVGCTQTTTTPVSYIYWPAGRLSPGTYEVEVWYQNTCDDPRPVNFGLTVNVQNQNVINISQTATQDSHYMITFTVEADGTVTAGPGGFFDMENPASLGYETQLDTATPITYGQTVTGSITDQQRFRLYSFEGQQGDIVTVGMNQSSGTLDPSLYLLSPQNILVARNDDVAPGENRNSLIEAVTLPSTGTYYVIATHYGLDVGGTQGTFNLTLVAE